MRRYILILLVAILALQYSWAQSSDSTIRGAKVELCSYQYMADSVYVDFDINVANLDISTKESVVFSPTIAKDGRDLALPRIVVRGRGSERSYRRSEALNNISEMAAYEELYGDQYSVVNYYGDQLDEIRENGLISYSYVLPYQSWMVDSEIYLGCATYGCGCGDDDGVLQPSDNTLTIEIPQVESYEVSSRLSLIKPEKVAVKRRDIQYSSALTFKVSSSYIDPNLANNQLELRSINSMMESIVSDSDYTITAVNIIGYASPEGTLKGNQILSEKRAKALESRLKGDYNIASQLYNVEFGGENWEALIPLIEGDSELTDYQKGEVLNIIENVSIEDGRERKVMDLNGGSTYRYLLSQHFPAVRLVVVDVEYNVDAYDLVRIKELIDVKPENLSLEEIYRLSETYDVESEEFLNLFLTAVELYPDDQVAVHNALVTQLAELSSEEALAEAESLALRLDQDSDVADVANTLGVYYMVDEQYQKAADLLAKAAALGSDDAQYNLEQLNAKLANIAEAEAAEQFRRKIYGDL